MLLVTFNEPRLSRPNRLANLPLGRRRANPVAEPVARDAEDLADALERGHSHRCEDTELDFPNVPATKTRKGVEPTRGYAAR